MEKDVLRKVQKIQLEMALEVKRICELHDIKYFIMVGTLLGAVRHKGFIPWDDDLDIGMLRSEYEKFLKCARKDLSSDYYLQTFNPDSGLGLPFSKIRKNGTKFVERNSALSGGHKGIYIDIFPFDNIPDSKFAKKVHGLIIYILIRIVLTQFNYEVWLNDGFIKKFLYKIIILSGKLIPVKKSIALLEKQMRKYNNKRTEHVAAIGNKYGYKKETIKRDWVENLTNIEFEGVLFPCPEDYDSYLKHFYGNYMVPPPEGQRIDGHGIIEVDVGDS